MEELIRSVDPALYWLFVAFSAFTENVFPPYPGDTVIVFGGALAGQNVVSLWSISIAVFSGSLSGAVLMFYLGERILDFFAKQNRFKSLKSLVNAENLKKSHDWFSRYGVIAVIFSRFSAGIRFFVAIVAGMVRMRLWVFIAAFSLATILWNGLLIYAGYVLGDNLQKAKEIIQTYNIIILTILVVLLLIYLVYRYKKRKKAK